MLSFLSIWEGYMTRLNLAYPLKNSICVFSHMLVDSPCISKVCGSQMLLYLQSAPSRFRLIPRDICDIVHTYLMREPELQRIVRQLQYDQPATCPIIDNYHEPCGHHPRLETCEVCFPKPPKFMPNFDQIIYALPSVPPTPEFVHRIREYVFYPNTNPKFDLFIQTILVYALRHCLPHLLLRLPLLRPLFRGHLGDDAHDAFLRLMLQ